MVLHAGEWSVTLDDKVREPRIICYAADQPLGQIAGGLDECVQQTAAAGAKTITVDAICMIRDVRVIVHGTIKAVGPDIYRVDSRFHFDRPNHLRPSEVSLGLTAKRLGPCQPGDAQG